MQTDTIRARELNAHLDSKYSVEREEVSTATRNRFALAQRARVQERIKQARLDSALSEVRNVNRANGAMQYPEIAGVLLEYLPEIMAALEADLVD